MLPVIENLVSPQLIALFSVTLSHWPGLLHGRGILQNDEHQMLNAGR